ncbi:recombinase family protein [Nocardia abscessus]|uniref:recombinase family protein n=1 Tax=Nocardia abscessus TaxID=120957 RepID=UPI001893D9DE|nr:recombinase family protein [Nocardia abscessus]MBF6336024.1 recombinase family protein [Nocardia abscessus]
MQVAVKAVIYVRISKDREGAGLGVERQRDECTELAERLGWTVAGVYEDNDISAYAGKKRPGYDAMCKALEEGEANAVIAWHVDRLHRRPIELEAFIDLCDRHQLEVRTVKAGAFDLSTASGKMIARMLGAASRHEVEHGIERQKAAKLQAARDGKYRGGRRSFGWEPDGMHLRPSEAKAISKGARDALSGVSLNQIAREWNESGLRTSLGGKLFVGREVKKILLRPRNAGISLHEGKDIANGQWEPIFDRDTLTALQVLLKDPTRTRKDAFERKWMGSNVYFCGKCASERVIIWASARRGSNTAPTYRCNAHAHLGRIAEPLDEYVTDLVVERLSRNDARIRLGSDQKIDIDALKASETAIEARLNELVTMFNNDEITGSQLKTGTAQKKAELEAVRQQIATARKKSILANLVLADEGIREAFEACSADVKGKIVDTLMTVTILPAPKGRRPGGKYFDPDYVQIEWKSPQS